MPELPNYDTDQTNVQAIPKQGAAVADSSTR